MKQLDYYEICKRKMKYLSFSENTIKCYLYYIQQFLNNCKNDVSRLNSTDFQSYLDNYKFTSVSQQNQVINAIRFLYKFGLERKYDKVSFIRPHKEKHLPEIMDKETIINKLSQIQNLKHKAILSLTYSAGLRVSEIINLKISDIDSKRMLIFIQDAKGKKDRYVPLTNYILELLRAYFKEYKPVEYLFNGQFLNQYSVKSCQELFKKYISTQKSIHNLRHSCFTHLLESGIDLRFIQNIAGHASSKTTEIYTHVSNNFLSKIAMPL